MSHLLKFIFIFCVIVAGAFYTGVRPPETLTIGPEGAEIALTSPFTSKSTSQSAGTPVQGKISRVVDGDTVHLKVGRETMKIRLDAIDTPEQDQAYGRQATSALKKKINRKHVLRIIR
jgi:endonuclease YncB( thermonuclease family)